MKFISWANGSKTYLICAAGVILGVLQAEGIHVPSYVDWVLVFLGGSALRHGIQTQSAATTKSVTDLINVILANVTVKDDTTGNTVQTLPVDIKPLSPIGNKL